MSGWFADALIASSLAMLLVLAIRTTTRSMFGPRIAYFLWAIPVLRFFLPPLPADWGFGWLMALTGGSIQSSATTTDATEIRHMVEPLILPGANGLLAPRSVQVSSAGLLDSGNLIAGLVIVWVIGVAAFVAYHLISYRAFRSTVLRNSVPLYALVNGRIRIIQSVTVPGPMAFGILRKYVALPHDLAEHFTPMERDLALEHELCHHARGDIYANWAAFAVLAVNWWNPIAWRSFHAFRNDQEMACDASVLAKRGANAKYAYGCAIAKSAGSPAISLACGLHTVGGVRRRLETLSQEVEVSGRRTTAGLTGIVALILLSLAATASGTPMQRVGPLDSNGWSSLQETTPRNGAARSQVSPASAETQTLRSTLEGLSNAKGRQRAKDGISRSVKRGSAAHFKLAEGIRLVAMKRSPTVSKSPVSAPRSADDVKLASVIDSADESSRREARNRFAVRFEIESLNSSLASLNEQRSALMQQPGVPADILNKSATVIDSTIDSVRRRIRTLEESSML